MPSFDVSALMRAPVQPKVQYVKVSFVHDAPTKWLHGSLVVCGEQGVTIRDWSNDREVFYPYSNVSRIERERRVG